MSDSCLGCCHLDQTLDKQEEKDSWMDGLMPWFSINPRDPLNPQEKMVRRCVSPHQMSSAQGHIIITIVIISNYTRRQ